MNIAFILAGGLGSRMGCQTPKQLMQLADGQSMLEHAVSAFEQAPSIDRIGIVMHPDYMDIVTQLCNTNHWHKVMYIVRGGNERWQSSWNAIQTLAEQLSKDEFEQARLLLHDAARPYVSQRIIEDVCSALNEYTAVTVAVPSVDTMYEVTNGVLTHIPPRATMMRAQTPQAFALPLIAEAYRLAQQSSTLQATDDCGIVHTYLPSTPIHIVLGDEQNKKITYSSDLA